MLSDLTENVGPPPPPPPPPPIFFKHCESEVLHTLHNYNLAGGLQIHMRFSDLDFVSVLQKIVFFRFLSSTEWTHKGVN